MSWSQLRQRRRSCRVPARGSPCRALPARSSPGSAWVGLSHRVREVPGISADGASAAAPPLTASCPDRGRSRRMIRSIIESSLRFRLLVLAIAAGVIVLGVTQLRSTPVDVLPEFNPPFVEVQTEALGLSAEEVEQLVTVPTEADLLNGTEGVTVLRSESVEGLSSITLLFEPGTDLGDARQLVQEQLTQAHANPNVSAPPQMLQPYSSQSRVMMIGLSPDELSPIQTSILARWVMRPRLLGVQGVANVSIFGLRDRQLQVLVDPQHLADKHVPLSEVVRTAGNAQLVSPLSFLEASTPGTGGVFETPNQRVPIKHILPT